MREAIEIAIQTFLDNHRRNEYRLQPYLLQDGKTHPVAILCPGGGYRRICSYEEGLPFARRLNALGYHAFVVYYRVRELARFPGPQDDLARAVREIFAHAAEWKLDMCGYSVWGSSAGGHLAASFGTESMGYAHYGLPRPGAMVLVYPVVTMDARLAHPGSRNNLLGPAPTPEQERSASIQHQITPAYPPTFLWWGAADELVPPDNSRLLQAALETQGIPCQCREYAGVGHGVGVRPGLPCEGWLEDAVRFWESQR